MKKRYYIAYGSNLAVDQMGRRAPGAKIAGTAVLYGWQLLFKVHATIEPNEKKNTPVLVWEISEEDERNLDRYEGFPDYYYKEDLQVEMFPADGGEPETVAAMAYIMADGRRLAGPSFSYYKVLEDGYRAFHFPGHVLEQALADSIGRDAAVRRLGECSLTRKRRQRKEEKGREWEERIMTFASRKELERLRRDYPAGCRIVLDEMDDPYAKIPAGTQGTCQGVDDAGNILCRWDAGSSLSVAYGADRCHRVASESEAEETIEWTAKRRQDATRCPRCGRTANAGNRMLALSRRADVTVCEACGMWEALEDAGMAERKPLMEWAAMKEGWWLG